MDDEDDADEETAAFNDAIKAATAASSSSPTQDPQPDQQADDLSPSTKSRQHPGRQASISLQSKMRSTSFRQGPLLPAGLPEESADSIYRKQSLKIEELERENTKLAKEAADGEARWRKSEEELEELRERAVDQTTNHDGDDQVTKLRAEIESLRRTQRQAVSAGRRSSISPDDSELRKELESRDSTISDLQLEISRLRSQLSSQTEGCETHGEQISALQSSLGRAEVNVRKLETELSDTKKALSRASEKAVVDGTERTSKDTKIRSLEKANESIKIERDDLTSKSEALEKKVDAMNKLHRETEERSNKKLTAAEAQARETQTLRARIETQEKEIGRLREAKKRTLSGSGGDEGLDELEDEERSRLERRVRELEGEVFDLRRGVWRDRRKEIQPGMTGDGDEFDDVDLSGSMPVSRRRSSTSRQSLGAGQTRHSGFTQVLNSGLAAFRGPTASPDTQKTRPRNDSLLQEFDDDEDAFDMNAFAMAQKEEEMRKMVEHVREVKRGLKQWVGWRLDLVDSRRGGGGIGVGEVFEI